MIQPAKYHLGKGAKKSVGMRATAGSSLLSTFRNPSGQGTSTQQTRQASYQNNRTVSNDSSADEEDELTSSKAPSVTTSPRNARIRRPTPVPDTSTSGGMSEADQYIDDFITPKKPKTKPYQPLWDEDTTPTNKDRSQDGDIVPTVWNSKKTQETEEERKEETQRLLRERQSAQVNPQHIRGAGFDAESVRKQDRKPQPGSGWDTGGIKRRLNSKYRSKATFGNRNRSSPQGKAIQSTGLGSDPESEGKEETKPTASGPSVTQTKREFRDPTKLYALPKKEVKEDTPVQTLASNGGFRNPLLEYPLPPKKAESQSGNDSDDYLPKSQLKGFQDPREKYKLPKKHEAEKLESKAFIDPFSRKYNLSPESEKEESQLQRYYIDESNDEISSINGTEKGGSKKRKASKAIGISTSKGKWKGQDDKFSSSDDTAEFSVEESQSSSQVRRMDDISLVLEETKLREQAKKRKAKPEIPDVCVLCNTTLPPGTLDAWRCNGELKNIRMAEWTEICNKHKEVDLKKEWKKMGYPVIEWGGLKKRVGKYHQFLVDIVEDKVVSPFKDVFAMQQKETRGNAAMLLRRDVQLQYPGYYGPRGSAILLHEITIRLGSFIGDTAKKDRLIGQGGVGAFIQTVLVPELGVRLIMEDMNVSESEARKTLDASREIGEKLHCDDFTEDIYDETDGPWFDINATQTPAVVRRRQGSFGISNVGKK